MTDLFANVPLFTLLAVAAAGSLIVIVRLLLQPVVHRLRVLAHIESDGARQAALEERLHALESCLDTVHAIRDAKTEHALIEPLLALLQRTLRGDLCAIVQGDERWAGSGHDANDGRIERAIRGSARDTADAGRLLAEPVPRPPGAEASWIVVARDHVAFGPSTHRIAARVATAVGLGLDGLHRLRTGERRREHAELSEETLRRAQQALSHTRQLGLHGELVHHLVRELTAPVTGVLGMAQFLAHAPDAGHPEEQRTLLDNALECRRILEQFAAISLADVAGRHATEVVDAGRVVREVVETARPRFRAKRVVLRAAITDGALLVCTSPTTLSRLACDLLLAGLSFAAARGGEVRLDVGTGAGAAGDECVRLDLLATARDTAPGDVPEMPEMPEERDRAPDLWHDVETIHLAVLEVMGRCIGARLSVDLDTHHSRLRLEVPRGRARVPLHAGLIGPYLCPSET